MGNSTRRNYVESFEYGFFYNRVGFQRNFTALSKQNAQTIYNFVASASEFRRPMGGSSFREFFPINVLKRYGAENYVLRRETLQNNRGLVF